MQSSHVAGPRALLCGVAHGPGRASAHARPAPSPRPRDGSMSRGLSTLLRRHRNAASQAVAGDAVAGSPAEDQIDPLGVAPGSIYGIPREEWLALQTPARYLGNEHGSIHKSFDDARVRFVMTYPEIYEVGASNLGHVLLYTCLNREEGVMCDRAYFPGPDMVEMLARHDRPLFAVESRRPLRDFDALGFSLAYELGGTNVLEMLRLSGIPITRQERMGSDRAGAWEVGGGSWPLVFAGGPTATSNPEPFSDFFDFFCIGDGEDALPEVSRCLARCRDSNLNREETLFKLATEVRGVYVPAFYEGIPGYGGAVFPTREGVPERVVRRVATPDPFMQVGLVPFVSTVHDRMSIEIRRGCTRGCRFCQPGMLTRPARDVDPDDVVTAVEEGIRKTGYNEFSLLSLSCSDYLSLPSVGIQIKNRLKDANVGLSLPSQRVDRFDETISNMLTTGGGKKGGLTFAPEAGTQRLRDIINKGLTNEELLRGVRTAWDQGWRQLYFMIGLPGETDADVLGIAETVAWLQRECRRGRQHLAVSITVSNFTPKPHTPFQWHSVSTEEFRRKQSLLRDALKDLPFVKCNMTPVEISAMEDFVGRADRSVGKVMRRAWEMGATNDGWWMGHEESFKCWSRAIEEEGLTWKYRQVDEGEWNVMDKLGDARYRKQGGGGKGRIDRGALADARLDAPLPWDHIDTGISKKWLKTDLQKALEAATVPDCSHSGICTECGVCDEEGGEAVFGHNVVFPPPPVPAFEGHSRPDTTPAQRIRMTFSKSGDMVFIGHLDTLSAIDRALRRAGLPVAMDGSPYSPRPRITVGQPLSLGYTGGGEVMEVVLTRAVGAEEVARALQAQLPAGMQILSSCEIPIRKLDGSLVESLPVLMDAVEYYVLIQDDGDGGHALTIEGAVERVRSAPSLRVPHRTKAGKRKTRDLREGLIEIEICPKGREGPMAAFAGPLLKRVTEEGRPWAVVRAKGRVEKGQIRLRADDVRRMMQEVSDIAENRPRDASAEEEGRRFEVVHVHRAGFDMREPAKPRVDQLRLRQLVRWEGFAGAARAFNKGPWAGPLETRDPVADGVVHV